jgi:hypothetical protein
VGISLIFIIPIEVGMIQRLPIMIEIIPQLIFIFKVKAIQLGKLVGALKNPQQNTPHYLSIQSQDCEL